MRASLFALLMIAGSAPVAVAGPEWPPGPYWECRETKVAVGITRIDESGGRLWFRGAAHDFVHDPATDTWRTLAVAPPREPAEDVAEMWEVNPAPEDRRPSERLIRVGGKAFRCQVQFRARSKPAPPQISPGANVDILFRVWADGAPRPEPLVLWSAGVDPVDDLEFIVPGEVHVSQRACAFDGQRLWIGFDFFEGEGFSGIGSLVTYDVATNAMELHQPSAFRREGIVSLGVHRGVAWMVPSRASEWTPWTESALVRYDPATREARAFKFEGSPLVDDEVGVLRVVGDAVWVAGGRHVYRIDPATCAFRRFRIVNFARLPAAGAQVFNTQDATSPRGMIDGTMTEALWSCPGWLQVATKDCVQGVVETTEWGERPSWIQLRTADTWVAFADPRLDGMNRTGAAACVHAGWVRDDGIVVVPEMRELSVWAPPQAGMACSGVGGPP